MNNNFNSNFYIVTATVIPVLYIALIVQFPMMDRIGKRLTENLDKLTKDVSPQLKLRRVKYSISVIGTSITFLIGAAIIISSINGELNSILALYRQSDDKGTRGGALLAVISLLIATLLIPTWTILTIYARFYIVAVIPKSLRERMRRWWQRTWHGIPNAEPQSSQENNTT